MSDKTDFIEAAVELLRQALRLLLGSDTKPTP